MKNCWPCGNFADFGVPLQENSKKFIIIDNRFLYKSILGMCEHKHV